MLLIPQPDRGSASSITNSNASARVGAPGRPSRFLDSSLPRKLWMPPFGGMTYKGAGALDVGIDMGLRLAASVRDGALLGVADGLSISPVRTRLVIVAPRL